MTPKEAADVLRPNFHLASMPPDARHHMLFVEQVTAELGIDASGFNLAQVASALDEAHIEGEPLEYPKMLYSRRHHAIKDIEASIYLPRHDCVSVHVANADEAGKLGSGFVEDMAQLPPRGDMPIAAEVQPPVPAETVQVETQPVI